MGSFERGRAAMDHERRDGFGSVNAIQPSDEPPDTNPSISHPNDPDTIGGSGWVQTRQPWRFCRCFGGDKMRKVLADIGLRHVGPLDPDTRTRQSKTPAFRTMTRSIETHRTCRNVRAEWGWSDGQASPAKLPHRAPERSDPWSSTPDAILVISARVCYGSPSSRIGSTSSTLPAVEIWWRRRPSNPWA